jgi:hypothetical protein
VSKLNRTEPETRDKNVWSCKNSDLYASRRGFNEVLNNDRKQLGEGDVKTVIVDDR